MTAYKKLIFKAKPILSSAVLLFVMSSLWSLSGCKAKNDKVKVAFLYSSKVTSRYVIESGLFKEKANELGAEVYIDEANNNESIQFNKAMELFDKNIDVLCLIAVNTNTAAAIVREGHKRDIKVIVYDRMVKSDKLSLFICGNNVKMGQDMANIVMKHKPRGKYIILSGDKFDRNAVELQKAILSTIKTKIKNKDIKILYQSYIENWDSKNAAFELDQYLSLTGERPDAVLSAYDGMTEGVITVLEKFGFKPGDVMLTGQDAELQAIKNIVSGWQLVTFYHPLKQLAYAAAEAAVGLANDKLPEKYKITYTDNMLMKVPTIKIPSTPVVKENIDKILIKQGIYTKEQLYQ
jgi:D-xylose transport system substrate-binding protein